MQVECGLFDHMVLQRNGRGVCDAAFQGRCKTRGDVMARVTKGRSVVRGFSGRAVGRAAGGKFAGRLKGVPAGGPYAIRLSVVPRVAREAETLSVRDVLVGDVWILGGQSNMQGIGLLRDAETPHRLVRAHYMDDRWDVARDPIHNMYAAIDPVHAELRGGDLPPGDLKVGTGPGVSFGREMHRITGVPQGLIACGHGGTAMSQWNPKHKRLGGRSLYGAMLRRFRRNGGRVAGVVWYQGESDANAPAAAVYAKRMAALVRTMRRDFQDPLLPVAMVQIGRVIGWASETAPHWNSVQDQQRRLGEWVRRLVVVPAVDLELDDAIHISGRDQCRLGRRLASAMAALTGEQKRGRKPIALKAVRAVAQPFWGPAEIVVEYDHVVGSLRATGRAAGFALAGAADGGICHVALDGPRAVLRTTVPFTDLGAMSLHYGLGTDPYCNVTDAAGGSLPVMGPVPVCRPRAMTPFVTAMSVSALQPSAGKLDSLELPPDLEGLGFRTRNFAGPFCDLHPELFAIAPKDVVVYFACRVRCARTMRLTAWLGYDGPVKVWVDGNRRFHDPAGTNPANPTDASVRFDAAAGEHTLVVALGSNQGLAWGVFVRLERRDVSQAALKKGQGFYELPEVAPLPEASAGDPRAS